MIVGVAGTAAPFQRLADALAMHAQANPDESVWMQYGRARLVPPVTGVALLARDALLAKMNGADVIVCHGGCGTLLDAISLGHVPVVVPRLARFGEHVNDHQLELVEELASKGRCVPVMNIVDLPRAIASARGRRTAAGLPGEAARFSAVLASSAHALVERSRPRSWVWPFLRVGTAWVRVRAHEPIE